MEIVFPGLMLYETKPEQVAQLVALSRDILQAQWTESFVNWKYFLNPAGPILGCCAKLNDELVGFYGNAPLRIKVGNQMVLGTQALDGMVAAKARRQGLFVKLGDWVHARMAAADVKLSYGIPNPVSRSALVKHMGWDYLGEIPRYVRVLKPTGLAQASGLRGPKALAYSLSLYAILATRSRSKAQFATGVLIREVRTFNSRFDDLWEQVATDFSIAVVRDRTYLTWRYAQNPLINYTILTAEQNNTIQGYVILSHRDLNKGVMAVAELLVVPGNEQAGLALLAAATAHARQAGAAQVQCWMLPQHRFYTRLLERSGFIYAPRRYLPGLFRYTTSLIVKLPPGSTLSPDPRNLDHWYMTMGDQDYY